MKAEISARGAIEQAALGLLEAGVMPTRQAVITALKEGRGRGCSPNLAQTVLSSFWKVRGPSFARTAGVQIDLPPEVQPAAAQPTTPAAVVAQVDLSPILDILKDLQSQTTLTSERYAAVERVLWVEVDRVRQAEKRIAEQLERERADWNLERQISARREANLRTEVNNLQARLDSKAG